jgi:hypothetical protein
MNGDREGERDKSLLNRLYERLFKKKEHRDREKGKSWA